MKDPIFDIDAKQTFKDMEESFGEIFCRFKKFGSEAIVKLLQILSLRWVGGLPDWAQPLVWGIIAPLPMILAFLIWQAIKR